MTGRIEIASAQESGASRGRALMRDHNLTARLWATGALLAVPLAPVTGTGWWLPLHMALLGAVTQAIAGGQLMFSATLGLSRGPSRRTAVTQLVLLNAGAALVVTGRLAGETAVLVTGASVVTMTAGWVVWEVHRMWRLSVNRRFSVTGTFYRLAGASLLLGASIGAALGAGAFDDAESYVAHRAVHMTLNVLGWAGMTIAGTAVTLLPTVLHVRAPSVRTTRAVPWLMFGGLTTMAAGATFETYWVAGAGMASYAAGLALFGVYVAAVLATTRRRKIPVAALHLVAALGWCAVTATGLVITGASGDFGAARDLVVVGGAAGFAFQALLGAWSFLLPSMRPPVPERRRAELVAMEVGARAQVLAYNAGLTAVLLDLRTGLGTYAAGLILAWGAATWSLTKSWTFPALARTETVRRRATAWWADPAE